LPADLKTAEIEGCAWRTSSAALETRWCSCTQASAT
jgi:hypothetical protein